MGMGTGEECMFRFDVPTGIVSTEHPTIAL